MMMWLTCILILVVGVTSFLILLAHGLEIELKNLKTISTPHAATELNTKICALIRCHGNAKQLS